MILSDVTKNKKRIPDPAMLLSALSHPTRKNIVEALCRQEHRISYFQELLSITYQTIYRHLQILEEAQLVTGYKIGKDKYYALNEEALGALQRWLTILANQLRASHAHYQNTNQTYDFGNTQQIGGDGREKHWYSESDI